jgi:hypothetical protein
MSHRKSARRAGLKLASTLALLVISARVAQALIVGPYTHDSATLHIWHLDEASPPAIDSAPGGTNLTALVAGATLGNPSLPGFGFALSTYDGGPGGTNAIGKDAALSALPPVAGSGDNITLRYAHPDTGAFTYEALVRPDFDPAMNFGPVANGGNGRNTSMIIIGADDDANPGRLLQFRINPIGTAGNTDPLLEFININKNVAIQNITVPVPMTGPDAIASNQWFHVAVVYDGNEGAPDNIKFYWTRMDDSRTNANLIGVASMNLDLPAGVSPDFVLGNTGRNAQTANFVGLIDEVRLSGVARGPAEMMFASEPPPPPTWLDCLLDFERHAESVWREATHANAPPDSGYFGDGRSGGNGGIRGTCGIAVSYAVLVRSLPNDPRNPTRLERIRRTLNYSANTHSSAPGTSVCVDGKRWARGWQTALWSGSMGFACLLVEDQLPSDTVEAVKRAVADESNYRAAIPPASGYINDSKGEENAWNSNILSLSAAWLATWPEAGTWLEAAKRYLVNTYTVANTNGNPLAQWITTVTLYPSFAMDNHGFYHPTYQMVSGMSLGDSLLMARMANPAIAAELQPFAEHNVINVWGMLSHVVTASSEFAYPSGLDWALHSYEQNSYYSWLAHHLNDPLARWADSNLVQLVRYRQIVNGDGRFVGESEANAFYREAVEARRTAFAWLHKAHADFPDGPIMPPPPVLVHYPDVKLIIQRGESGFLSLSYGAKIMALIEPAAQSIPTNVFVTTPRVPSILGLGALGNPTAAQLVNFATNANATGFDAELLLQHGSSGATAVYVRSTGESVAIIEVPLPAGGISSTPVNSFSVGIENHPLTGGSRLLEWTGGSALMIERSGAIRNITNDWLCLSGLYGMAGGPTGFFRYQTASSYNRLGAAQDTLSFVPDNSFAPRYAVWFLGSDAAATMAAASLISWTNSGTNAVLAFPGPGGLIERMTVALPAPVPHPPYPVETASVSASSSQAAYPPELAVDGNLSTFWVSGGSAPGEGPTLEEPEWLHFLFPRTVAVSEFEIVPRTLNTGYGPKDIQVLFDNAPVYQGTMVNAALRVQLSPPRNASQARLVITSSYDPVHPANSRNVQVVEVMFRERALPGTFADWALRRFSAEQFNDPSISGPLADPDADGAPNLLEFAVAGDPLNPDDASLAAVHSSLLDHDTLAITFRERKAPGDLLRHLESTSDLVLWLETVPLAQTTIRDEGEAWLRQAIFPIAASPLFFRIAFRLE